MSVSFELLGPLRVRNGSRELAVTARREQILLAMLLLQRGGQVDTGSLIDAVWEDSPPSAATTQIHGTVYRLRRRLATVEVPPDVIVADGSGYRATVSADQVDLWRFRRLQDEARAVAGTDVAGSRAGYRSALRLWRGAPFGGLDSAPLRHAATALAEERLQAVEERIRLDLAAGVAGELVAELSELTGRHPYREGLQAALMTALHRAGRHADALAVFQRVRRLLREELGTEPGSELRELHLAILNRSLPGPVTPPTPTPTAVPPPTTAGDTARTAFGPPVPRQLPADPYTFVGRDTELTRLTALLDGERPDAVVVTAIDGMAGVGKTALAVRVGHRVAARYPDGQIFVDLHGHTVGGTQVAASDVLARLLRTLGVPDERIPAGTEDRSALWRSLLADRRLLVVLDNAASEPQVTPLLPGSPGCAVLVTSRRGLTGLPTTHPVSLEVLPEPEAVSLFTRTVGDDRLAAEPADLVARTVALCGRLPLAIRLAGARFRSRPAWRLTDLVSRLEGAHSGLPDELSSVAVALDVTFAHLDRGQQRLYRLLALHPGDDLEPYAAAALAGTTVRRVRTLIEALLDVHVLQERTVGRYAYHDLVRAHARRASERVPAATRRAALGRLLAYYQHAAATAMNLAYPYEQARRPPAPTDDGPLPDLSDPTTATRWLDQELPNLLAVAGQAAEQRWPGPAHQLPATLHRHLHLRGRQREAAQLHELAARTARDSGDRHGELTARNQLSEALRFLGDYDRALAAGRHASTIAEAAAYPGGRLDAQLNLGHLELRRGRHPAAADHYRRALALADTTVGAHPGGAEALLGLGHTEWLREQPAECAEHYTTALERARATGHRTAEVDALLGLGRVALLHERTADAVSLFRDALAHAREIGAPTAEMNAISSLGHTRRRQGRIREAGEHYQRALEIGRSIGHRAGETNALVGLGHIHRLEGRYAAAAGCFQEALEFAEQVRNQNWQFEALHGLGRVRYTVGDPRGALDHHGRALLLATGLGQPRDQARAHDGLARAHLALDRREPARRHWQQALDILTDHRIEQTEEEETSSPAIRAALSAL